MKHKLSVLSMLAAVSLFAADSMKIEVGAPPNCIVKLNEPVTFTMTLRDEAGKPKADQSVDFAIRGNSETVKDGTMTTDANGQIKVTTTLTKPGFTRIEFCIRNSNPRVNAFAGAGAEWEKVQPGMPCPEDFAAFWKKMTDEMKAMPLNAKAVPVPALSQPGKVDVFDITCDAPGERPMRGYFSMPADATKASCPAMISFQGAGVHDSYNPSGMTRDYHAIAMNINAHGLDNGLGKDYYLNLERGDLSGYRFYNVDSRENNYFKDMYRRLYRAMQYLKSRPEWDGKTLIVIGTSQGGGQSVAAAGLDPDVTCLVAHVPALCDMGGGKAGHDYGWPGLQRQWVGGLNKRACDPEKSMQEMRYMDGVNFARFVNPNADVYLSTGLNDPYCGAACVSAVYNVMNVHSKKILISPGFGHNVNPVANKEAAQMIRDHIARMAKTVKE